MTGDQPRDRAGSARGRPVTVLLSGGVDSTVVAALLIDLGRRPEALFVDYGQPAAVAEAHASAAVARDLGLGYACATVSGLAVAARGEIPGRNDVLIALARATRPLADIAIGTHAGTGYPDCSPEHSTAWQSLIDLQTGGTTRLVTPLRDLHKRDVLDLAGELDVPLCLTHSCEAGNSACGTCSSCLDRRDFDNRRDLDSDLDTGSDLRCRTER